MKSINNIKKVLFVLLALSLSLFTFNGCGYKPTVSYAKKELAGKVFVKLFVNLKDPRNAVIIKDSMNQLLVQKLGAKLVYDEAHADTVMNLKINSVNMSVLQYNSEGYNQLYRASVDILVNYRKKVENSLTSFTVSGESDFSVTNEDGDDRITDTVRYEAIKDASDDALDEVLSKIAVASFRK